MSIEERKLSMTNKSTSLNPNAEEFVPSSLRSVNDASKRSDGTMILASGPARKASTDQPGSITESNADEEAHQYWQQQLPDDITPDFNVLGQDETPGPDSLSLTGLSISDGIGASIFSPNQSLGMQHRASPFTRDKQSIQPKIEFTGPTYLDELSQSMTMSPTAAPWVKTVRNGGQYSANRRDAGDYNGDSGIGASFQSLTDAYHGSRRSLSSTMDIISQLENKADGQPSQNLRSLPFGHSSPSSPAAYARNSLSNYSKEAFGLPNIPYRPHSTIFADDIVSPSTGGEHVSLDTPRGRYRTTDLPVSGLGSNRISQLLGGSYNGHHDMISTNNLQNLPGIQTGPAWLESDTAASAYLEPKEGVHEFASLQHALLEQQDRQAFLLGSNPLAKDPALKELYNMQSRLAQEKARETSYRQRFQMPELQVPVQEQNPPIDLCGLHVSEAILVLNHELNNRRKNARFTGRRLQVIILSSARTARLTVAIVQYLMEHGLQYTQVQPGIFRVLLA